MEPFILRLTITFLVLGAGTPVWADSPESVCAQFEGARQQNCLVAFEKVPNKRALEYTFKFWKLNEGQLQDRSCVKHDQGIAAQGIRNDCEVQINDINSDYKGQRNRANSYFIDLCAKSPDKVVYWTSVKKGTGTIASSFDDQEGRHTSVPGAFLTAAQVREFVPFAFSKAYQTIKAMLGSIPGLTVVGLQSTNNDTSKGKPIHVSPYQTSWGCPSLDPKDAWILRRLAAHGPSLVMNYGPDSYHTEGSLTKCDDVPDSVRSPARSYKRVMRSRVRGKLYTYRWSRRHGYYRRHSHSRGHSSWGAR